METSLIILLCTLWYLIGLIGCGWVDFIDNDGLSIGNILTVMIAAFAGPIAVFVYIGACNPKSKIREGFYDFFSKKIIKKR